MVDVRVCRLMVLDRQDDRGRMLQVIDVDRTVDVRVMAVHKALLLLMIARPARINKKSSVPQKPKGKHRPISQVSVQVTYPAFINC